MADSRRNKRDRVMRRLRDGGLDLLVATDVAARGLDIGHLSHVFNFDVPSAADAYVHRIGRTGRAGREGTAITLAEPRESRMLKTIEHHTGQKIRIEPIPSVVDLRAKRLEKTRAALRQAVEDGKLESFRTVAESLGEEFDLLDVAAAAVKLAHEAAGNRGEEEGEKSLSSQRIPREKTNQRANAIAAKRRRHRNRNTGAWCASTSHSDANQTFVQPISLERSQTNPVFPAEVSGRSRWGTDSRSSKFRSHRPMPSSKR